MPLPTPPRIFENSERGGRTIVIFVDLYLWKMRRAGLYDKMYSLNCSVWLGLVCWRAHIWYGHFVCVCAAVHLEHVGVKENTKAHHAAVTQFVRKKRRQNGAREKKKICPVIRSTFFMRAGARKAKCARALRTTKPSIIATIARISGLQHHHDLRAYPSNAAFKINFSWSDRN